MQRTKTLAAALIAAAFLAAPAAHAGNEARDLVYRDFVEHCDTDKDGMVSKAEMMKMVEKTFDRVDTRKAGKIDKRQVEAFLDELMKSGG